MNVRAGWPGVVEAYRRRLPLDPDWPAVSLLEGNTPLVPSRRIGPELGIELFFKVEGMNPTGSFKDRGMAAAMTRARGRGARVAICASTGNTAASAAAYAARAGLAAWVVVPAGFVARGKLAQSIGHGARFLQIDGNFDAGLDAVRAVAAARPEIELVNSVNPLRLEGQKTAAFEVVEQLGGVPDILAIPVGNAGNISAYWRGFSELRATGEVARRPRLLGVQAEGAAPLVLGRPVDRPETVATAIRIGRPASGPLALAAAAESGGWIVARSDVDILNWQARLGREEGILCEPASAASVAGLSKLVRDGRVQRGQTAVAVLTGHGLKDPDRWLGADIDLEPVPPDPQALLHLLEA